MNSEIVESLIDISVSMEIIMRNVIEEKYNMNREDIIIEDWVLEIEKVMGRRVVDNWNKINELINSMEGCGRA